MKRRTIDFEVNSAGCQMPDDAVSRPSAAVQLPTTNYQLPTDRALPTTNYQLPTWFRAAFTLIEVNLAIFIMAGGVLAMISLYSLGFRESRQSREDVASAAFADEVLNPLVIALSSRKMKWTEWCKLEFGTLSSTGTRANGNVQVLPSGGKDKSGWLAYVETRGSGRDTTYYVSEDPKGKANGVYQTLIRSAPGEDLWQGSLPSAPDIPAGMTYALVASRESKTSPVITLAVRCVRKNLRNTLMAQPIFSTEVHFQGDPNN